MKKAVKCLFVNAILVAVTLAGQMASAQKNTNRTTATQFILDDTTGVSSDGVGPYVHGQSRVGAMIDSAGDFRATFYTGSKRSLKINYSNPVDPLNAPFSGTHVVNAASTESYDAVTVRDLLGVPIGATTTRPGNILLQKTYIDPSGIAHIVTQNWNAFPDQNPDGLLFSVSRPTANQWVVESQNIPNGDRTYLKFFHGSATGWVYESGAEYNIHIRMTITR